MRKQKDEHTLIVIGFMGDKQCYLDIGREQAILRYKTSGSLSFDDEEWADFEKLNVKEIKFEDEFCAYDAWDQDRMG
jgi:hypothetical protein